MGTLGAFPNLRNPHESRFPDKAVYPSPFSLRERGWGVRVKYLLKPEAPVLKATALVALFDLRFITLTPALSRRERVSYIRQFAVPTSQVIDRPQLFVGIHQFPCPPALWLRRAKLASAYAVDQRFEHQALF